MRKIIKINEEKCNGCGICVNACHEGALQMVNGKAKLISESYCDGLGACLPECPVGAIEMEEREACTFDEEAVKKNMTAKQQAVLQTLACGCSGTEARIIKQESPAADAKAMVPAESQLRQWPCQIKLIPVNAPYLDQAHLLVAADCTAYAYAGFHQDFMQGRVTMIGCPKLDDINYADKLTDILRMHEVKSITILKMEVPCCNGIVNAVKTAFQNSGKLVPWSVITLGTDGRIIEQI